MYAVSCAWPVNGSSGLDELGCGWFSGGLTAGGAAALESSAGSMLIALLAVLGVDLIVLVVVLIAVLVRRRWVSHHTGSSAGRPRRPSALSCAYVCPPRIEGSAGLDRRPGGLRGVPSPATRRGQRR